MLPPQFAVWSNHRDSRNDAKKTPAPSCAPDTMRIVAICIKGIPLGASLAISLEHACEMGPNMEWPERNIRLKGLFTSPEASRDRLTAVRAVSAIGAQLAVYTGRRETHHARRLNACSCGRARKAACSICTCMASSSSLTAHSTGGCCSEL